MFFNFINLIKTEKKKMVQESVAECYVRFLVAFLSHSQESIFGFVLNSEVIVCSLT